MASKYTQEINDYLLNIEAFSPEIIRVSKYSDLSSDIEEISQENLDMLLDPNLVIQNKDMVSERNFGTVSVSIGQIRISVTNDGVIAFSSGGEHLLSDTGSSIDSHNIKSSKKPFKISQNFQISSREGLFGLGQHQTKNLNWRGEFVHLVQHNTIVSVPILLSTRGYAIVWENVGESWFKEENNIVNFQASRADAIHYWVIPGTNFDDIIRKIRYLFGKAPMYAKWGYGFVQSRNRYWTRDEVMKVVKTHRKMELPFDVIVIDYVYYGKHGVGSHKFDEEDYPNPREMIREFHENYNCKLLLSIWPTFAEQADTYEYMKKNGYLLDCQALGGWFYDPFNQKAGEAFWDLLKQRLFKKGVDAWWLDASEPDDEETFRKIQTAKGDAMDYLNLYSLYHTKHIYNGQISENSEKRPFLLTRSAFIGQQRHATATWSGDVRANYDDFQKQIPSGLNFCATGIPYWCTDIGGYKGGWSKNPIYRELFVRWFQYGTFCPIFRSHGRRWPFNRKGKNEIWEYGRRATKILRNYMNLRYKLLPYIYTLAWKTWKNGYTIMRMLPFDFPEDPKTYNASDQFMFGPSLMICPVTKFLKRKRGVYLPEGKWYDFWTGNILNGGKVHSVKAKLSRMPIFVKRGTILTLGPILQYSTEKKWDQFEVRVYPGVSGQTTLYLDDGDTNYYKEGEGCLLSLIWDENNQNLSVEVVKNNFLKKGTTLTFRVFIVKSKEESGIELESHLKPDQELVLNIEKF